jgi:hypothetical protein
LTVSEFVLFYRHVRHCQQLSFVKHQFLLLPPGIYKLTLRTDRRMGQPLSLVTQRDLTLRLTHPTLSLRKVSYKLQRLLAG